MKQIRKNKIKQSKKIDGIVLPKYLRITDINDNVNYIYQEAHIHCNIHPTDTNNDIVHTNRSVDSRHSAIPYIDIQTRIQPNGTNNNVTVGAGSARPHNPAIAHYFDNPHNPAIQHCPIIIVPHYHAYSYCFARPIEFVCSVGNTHDCLDWVDLGHGYWQHWCGCWQHGYGRGYGKGQADPAPTVTVTAITVMSAVMAVMVGDALIIRKNDKNANFTGVNL
jgi:hypothetical protein